MSEYKKYIEKSDKLIQDQKWVDYIIQKGCYCCICGCNDNPLILEEHHISGKSNSNLTITVCPNCHKKLTIKQKSWDKDWKKNNNSPKQKLAFILRGKSDILRIMSEQCKELSDKILAGEI